MGKLIFTNIKEWYKKLDTICASNGFISSYEICDTNYLNVYKKLKVDNENFFIDGKEYVASNGTIIYKNCFGIDALKAILEDFKSLKSNMPIQQVIKNVRKDIIGQYCIIIGDNDNTYLFVDELGSFALYYYINDNKYLITEFFYHIGKIVQTEFNPYAYGQKLVRGGWMTNNESLFKDVYRLRGNEYIEWNNTERKITVKEAELNNYKYKFESFDDVISVLEQELYTIAEKKSLYLKDRATKIFVTGGMDSRLELALHLKCNNNIQIGYWSGNDIITNGTDEDLEISKKLAEKIDAKFTFYDVSVELEQCFEKLNESQWDKYGEYASVYANNKKWFDIAEDQDEEVIGVEFGYFGEYLRELDQLDLSYHDEYTLDEFIDYVYCRSRNDIYTLNIKDFRKYLREMLKTEASHIVKSNTLTLDEANNLFQWTRFHADTVCSNFYSMYYYGFSTICQKRIIDLLDCIPYEWKNYGRLILRLTRDFAPVFNDVRYYSHHNYLTLDANNLVVAAEKKHKVTLFFQHKLYKYHQLYKLAAIVLYLCTQRTQWKNSKNQHILKITNEQVRKMKVFGKYNIWKLPSVFAKYFDLNGYIQAVCSLKMLDSVED